VLAIYATTLDIDYIKGEKMFEKLKELSQDDLKDIDYALKNLWDDVIKKGGDEKTFKKALSTKYWGPGVTTNQIYNYAKGSIL